jgi:hypothetical protein
VLVSRRCEFLFSVDLGPVRTNLFLSGISREVHFARVVTPGASPIPLPVDDHVVVDGTLA